MKAAVLHKARDIRIEDVPEPKIGAKEVLIRVRRVGVCGSDLHCYFSGRIGAHVVERPMILGHECAGDVVEVGERVEGIEQGMRVAVEPGAPCGGCECCRAGIYNVCKKMRFMGTPPIDGALCEYVAWPAEFVFPLPESVSYEDGAMIEPAAVGVYSARLAEIRKGRSAAVLGAATIGLMTLQAAAIAGARETFVTDLIPARLELAKQLGATAAINSTHGDPVKEILGWTNGEGVDVVFEAAGATATLQQCVGIVKPCGMIILIGINEEDVVPFDLAGIRRKEATIKAVRRYRHVFPKTIRLAAERRLDVSSLITHRFPISQIEQAFELARECRDGVVKVMIVL